MLGWNQNDSPKCNSRVLTENQTKNSREAASRRVSNLFDLNNGRVMDRNARAAAASAIL